MTARGDDRAPAHQPWTSRRHVRINVERATPSEYRAVVAIVTSEQTVEPRCYQPRAFL